MLSQKASETETLLIANSHKLNSTFTKKLKRQDHTGANQKTQRTNSLEYCFSFYYFHYLNTKQLTQDWIQWNAKT